MASTTAFFTGLSGLIANARRLDVIGNNIANVNTTSFKSNRMSFAPNFSRNFSLGTAPGANSGGTNPFQVGLGVGIAGTQRSFTNGAIGATGVTTDVAIEGDGFFVVELSGSRFFTRDGEFLRSPNNDLVTKTGAKVMGYGTDDSFNIVEGNLVELNVPLGTLTLAEATQNVIFNGNLNAAGTVATTGSVHASRTFYLDNLGASTAAGTEDLTSTDLFISDGAGGYSLAFDGATNPKIITISGIEKGGKDLGDHTFAISASAVPGADSFGTTLDDIAAWMEDVLGLDSTATGASSDLGGGVALSAGSLVITGNEGTVQELGIETGNFTVSGLGSGSAQPFVMSKTGDADGESVRTSFVVYDSLGTPLTIDLSMVLQATTASGGTSWQYVAESNDNDGVSRVLGLGELTFDAGGRFLAASNNTFSIRRSNGATDPLTVSLNFAEGSNAVSGLTDTASSIAAVFQDGSAIGTLSNFSIGSDGVLSGSFTNGLTRTIGQIAVAKFTNPAGLMDAGNNYFQVGPNSGTALITSPQNFGTGRLVGGALELSNVDLSQEFINMILASTGYSAASRVITTTDELINQLLALGR